MSERAVGTPTDQMAMAIEKFAQWCGAVHDADCPEDDTCECSGKWINDGITAAVNYLRSMETPAPDPVRGTPQPHRVADFLQKLPDMASPEVCLEDDGDIGFDWFGPDSNVVLSAHIGRNGNGGWSALIGDYKSFGRFSLDAEWPDDFLEALRRFNTDPPLVSGKQEEPTR